MQTHDTAENPHPRAETSAAGADASTVSDPIAEDPLIARLAAAIDMMEAKLRRPPPADDIPADVPRFEVW